MTLSQRLPGEVSCPRPYQDTYEHLADELRRLDVRIRLRLVTLHLRNALAPEGQVARTFCISDEEVDWLLERGAHDGPEGNGADRAVPDGLRDELERVSSEIAVRTEASDGAGIALRLPALGRLFGLTAMELDAVVIGLAPELRRKYDRLYAYLQDDLTRKRPSVDLVLELLCPQERRRWAARRLFTATAPLLRYGIFRTVDDPQSPSGSTGLAQFLALDPRICQYLLGSDDLDARLAGRIRMEQPPETGPDDGEVPYPEGPARLALHHLTRDDHGRTRLIVHLHGPAGAGKNELARRTSHWLGMPLLGLDLHRLTGRGDEAGAVLRAALREALLQSAAVHLAGAEVLQREDEGVLLGALSDAVVDFGGLLFLSGETEWPGVAEILDAPVQPFAVPLPDVPRSIAHWRRVLQGHAADPEGWAAELATRFPLSSDRMRAVVEQAENQRLMESADRPLTLADITAACRDRSRSRLGGLAVRVRPRCRWADLVLPDDRIAHLREICDQARHRHHVHDTWGFDARLSHGKALSVLFSGPPGTGKTMAAEVLAHDLEVDLYKVDLSGIVSKYVGETEKNLAWIFTEAQAAGAILFFDEADALYGKRTEVSNAHDRYANIETSYLLQRMEEYDGMVILATNLRQNLDDAFTRRLRFVVEFPIPDAESRQRIWQTLFPSRAPISPDLDFAAFAREFPVAGGNIKNIVLNAAFLAAAEGSTIGRQHLLRGTRREFEKIGKLWSEPCSLADEPSTDSVGGE
jgi:MoxR-like ATPase